MNKKYIDAYNQIITQGWFGKKKAQIKSAVKNLFKSGKTKNKEKNETLNKFIVKYGLSRSNDQSDTWQKKLLNFTFKMKSVSAYSNKEGIEQKTSNKYETLTCELINRKTDKVEYKDNVLFKYNWPLKELEEDIQEFLLRAKISLSDLKKGGTGSKSYDDIDLGNDDDDTPRNKHNRSKFNDDEKYTKRNNRTNGGAAAKRRQLKQILNKLTPEQRQFLQNSLKDK